MVCSVIVSTAAVLLKPAQEANKDLDRKRNILAAGGMLEDGKTVDELFERIEARYVDMRTGRFAEAVPPGYDQRSASKDPALSRVDIEDDPAKIGRRADYAEVYLVAGERRRPRQDHSAGSWLRAVVDACTDSSRWNPTPIRLPAWGFTSTARRRAWVVRLITHAGRRSGRASRSTATARSR